MTNAFLVSIFPETARGRDISFAADDGFNPGFSAGLIKMDGAEHIAMIGHSQSGHTQARGFFNQLIHAACAV